MNLGSAAIERIANCFSYLENLEFYTGSMPATPETLASGTLILSMYDDIINASDASFSVLNGVATLSYSGQNSETFAQGTAVADGSIGYARLRVTDVDNNSISYDLTVGVAGSGADIELPSLSILTGDIIKLNSLTWTVPSSN